MRGLLLRWALHGFPTLAVMAVVMALYLAPTKDDYATALVLALEAVSLLAGRGRQDQWRVLWLLWPLALLGAYAVLLDLGYPQANALPLLVRLHPWGVGMRSDLMNLEVTRSPDGIDRSQNTAGDNFLIETGLAFGFVGLGLYAIFWWRILRIGVSATAQKQRRPVFALLTVVIAMVILRGFVDVLSLGRWYYWIALVGILSGCAFQNSPRLRSSQTTSAPMLKRFLKRLIRGRYNGLNGLDKKIEAYIGYDGGYFVELGANDGVSQSNTLYFEKYRGWRGLLVEPAPHNYLQCRANRSAANSIHCAACVSFAYKAEFVRIAYSNLMSTPLGLATDISDPLAHAQSGRAFLGQSEDIFEYGAVARTLNDLLVTAGAPKSIDFLSLDVEGAELEVLQGVDHGVFRFKFILVECRDFNRMQDFLVAVDYAFVEKLSEQDYLFRSLR